MQDYNGSECSDYLGHTFSGRSEGFLMKLTPKLIRKLVPHQESKEVERVDASKQSLVEVR